MAQFKPKPAAGAGCGLKPALDGFGTIQFAKTVVAGQVVGAVGVKIPAVNRALSQGSTESTCCFELL